MAPLLPNLSYNIGLDVLPGGGGGGDGRAGPVTLLGTEQPIDGEEGGAGGGSGAPLAPEVGTRARAHQRPVRIQEDALEASPKRTPRRGIPPQRREKSVSAEREFVTVGDEELRCPSKGRIIRSQHSGGLATYQQKR